MHHPKLLARPTNPRRLPQQRHRLQPLHRLQMLLLILPDRVHPTRLAPQMLPPPCQLPQKLHLLHHLILHLPPQQRQQRLRRHHQVQKQLHHLKERQHTSHHGPTLKRSASPCKDRPIRPTMSQEIPSICLGLSVAANLKQHQLALSLSPC